MSNAELLKQCSFKISEDISKFPELKIPRHIMDINNARFIRILHRTVEEFIFSLKNSFLPEIIDTQKVYCEIVKRRESIIQELRSIAHSFHSKTCLENKDLCAYGLCEFPEWESNLRRRIENFVQDIFSQDLLEIALNRNEKFKITDRELHNLLYSGALRDITSFAPLSIEMEKQFNFCTPFFTSVPIISEETADSAFLSCFQMSSQFQRAHMQLNDDIIEMRRITESGFSVSDLNKCNVTNTPSYDDHKGTSRANVLPEMKCVTWWEDCCGLFSEFDLGSPDSLLIDSEIEKQSDISGDSGVRSWEDCLGQNFLHEHMYISEISSEAAHFNISDKEYHVYSSLVNQSDAIAEDEMVLDILDVLTGTPSNTFFYDIHARRFKMKAGIHLRNLSSECTTKIIAKFIESGSMYYALQNFSRDFLHASEGSVFKGIQYGIQQVLSVYKEYIEAVKVNSPTMVFLKNDIIKNAELMLNFGIICGIDPERMIINEIPKGLGLLSYLHDVARSHKRKESGIMIAVLLKYAYAPYFSFLNEWMTEGCCNDPHKEFQIVEDANFLRRRDYLFWKFAYTECIDDSTRVVPPEIKDFSQGILDCGKSIKLLKYLSPKLYNLIFFSYKPLPYLSMVYSFSAVIQKTNDCMSYILLKANIDSIPNSDKFGLFDDNYYIESQKLMNKEEMVALVTRRYNIILAGKVAKSNMLDFKRISHYLNYISSEAQNCETESSKSQRKCDCIPVTITENEAVLNGKGIKNVGPLFTSFIEKCVHGHCFKNFNFASSSSKDSDNYSGKLYNNIGLIFSSCGYVEKDTRPNTLIRDASLPNFSKQLCLSSYSHFSSPAEESTCDKFSSPIKNLWNSNQYANMILKTLNFEICDTSDSKRNFIMNVLLNSLKEVSNTKKENCGINVYKNRNSFMDKLTSLLISEYNDSVDEIYSCIQVTSLQRLMVHNFQSVLKTRIHVVGRAIMKCIVKEYQLDYLLSSLQNIYFLQDEIFNQSLCSHLFERVMKCKTPGEFAKYTDLNEILVNAISDSAYEYDSSVFSINVDIGTLPTDISIERIDFLHLFVVECKVNWPLNIIVHQICIQQYLRIFSMLLEIEFLCWLLGRAWKHLILVSKDLHIQDAPQFREIMLNRFEMDQFIRVIRNSIHQHLQGPLWKVLEKSLSAEESSMDDLEAAHNQYLEKVLARCFLTDETFKLHDFLSSMFHQVYKICSAVLECIWKKNHQTGYYETSIFAKLAQAFEIFSQHQKIFLSSIMKESLTKKCGRYWDKDYESFLETIVETKCIR